MTTQNQSEKEHRPATSSHANAPAEAQAPSEIEQELIDEELRSISGGAYQTTSWPGAEINSSHKLK
jgi:hypothetical protein